MTASLNEPVASNLAIPNQPMDHLPLAQAPQHIAGNELRRGRQFAFDGGAATYFGTAVLGLLITVFTLGICYPFALVLVQRWRTKHSYVDGHQLTFTGSAWGLFGNWIKWWFLVIVTLGIYSFWVGPRLARWKWENTGFAQRVQAVRQA